MLISRSAVAAVAVSTTTSSLLGCIARRRRLFDQRPRRRERLSLTGDERQEVRPAHEDRPTLLDALLDLREEREPGNRDVVLLARIPDGVEGGKELGLFALESRLQAGSGEIKTAMDG